MSTVALYDAFLHERYGDASEIENLMHTERPAWAMLEKDENCSGDVFVEPLIAGNPQGLGATRAKAQAGMNQTVAGASSVLGYKWNLTFGDYAAGVLVTEKLIRASKDDPGAFFRAQQLLTDALYEQCADTFSAYLYSNGGQSVAGGTNSSGVITLTDKESIANIQLGQILVASANDGSSSSHTLLGSGAQGYVIARDPNAGTFTVSATSGGSAGTPSGWTGTMFFFRDGDFGGSGATPIFNGFGYWVPAAAPSGGDNCYGVDRSTNGLLHGVRLTSTEVANMPIDQRLKRLVTRMTGRFSGPGPDSIFLNPERWQDLADLAETRGQRPLDGKIGTINFSYLQIAMGGKMVKIYGDRFCPLSTAFALRMKNWKCRSYGGVPSVLSSPQYKMLLLSAADTYEHRLVAFPVVSTNAPSYSGRSPV